MKKIAIAVSLGVIVAFSTSLFAREPLTFEERVKAQEAIEKVYYSHRIWPKENPQPKPPFEKMIIKEQIEAKVTDYLKKSAAIDQFWQRPIEGEQLQAEMDRMAKGTKDPATLNELFEALNNDPYLIAECLARPVLADRLIRNWYANDERFHKETREKAEEALKHLTPENFCSYPEGQYSKMTYKLEIEGREEMEESIPEDNVVNLDEKEFIRMLTELPEEGKISGVIEKNDCLVIIHTKEKNEGGIEIHSLLFAKQGVDEWLKAQVLPVEIPNIENGSTNIHLPPLPESACTEGWSNLIPDYVPHGRSGQCTVWTGTEMIIWGGSYWEDSYLETGERYSPLTDTWQPIMASSNTPSGRSFCSFVWTGSQMIIWGGQYYDGSYHYYNDGGRYDPSTDLWSPTSIAGNTPSARSHHTAVWTGSEMIIWGGYDGSSLLNTGARYDPSGDLWVPTSTAGSVPSARRRHLSVWTDTEMIIWGGSDNTGGRYSPNTDSWLSTSTGTNCPTPLLNSTVIWTGTEMIVWGGSWYELPDNICHYENTGARYNPSLDNWTPTSIGTNCPSGRDKHTAVWTKSEMIIWGGDNHSGTYYGGRYDPLSDTWIQTSYGIQERYNHSAVWTGTEMIVWGGGNYLDDGGRYDPQTDSWVPTFIGNNVPAARDDHTAIWTGSEMIIWGGQCPGGRYYPSTGNWIPTSTGTNCPAARYEHTAVWTGSEMIVWGGGTVAISIVARNITLFQTRGFQHRLGQIVPWEEWIRFLYGQVVR